MFQGKHPQRHYDQLAGDESHQSTECPIHKTIGMQADAKHINSEPGETEHDVAKNTHHRKSTFANQATPAGVKNNRVPHYDKKRAVLLRVPSPESTPRLIGPDSSQDGSNEAEQGSKANDPVHHSTKCHRCRFVERGRKKAAEDIDNAQEA